MVDISVVLSFTLSLIKQRTKGCMHENMKVRSNDNEDEREGQKGRQKIREFDQWTGWMDVFFSISDGHRGD